jgi:hypothetical protein
MGIKHAIDSKKAPHREKKPKRSKHLAHTSPKEQNQLEIDIADYLSDSGQNPYESLLFCLTRWAYHHGKEFNDLEHLDESLDDVIKQQVKKIIQDEYDQLSTLISRRDHRDDRTPGQSLRQAEQKGDDLICLHKMADIFNVKLAARADNDEQKTNNACIRYVVDKKGNGYAKLEEQVDELITINKKLNHPIPNGTAIFHQGRPRHQPHYETLMSIICTEWYNQYSENVASGTQRKGLFSNKKCENLDDYLTLLNKKQHQNHYGRGLSLILQDQLMNHALYDIIKEAMALAIQKSDGQHRISLKEREQMASDILGKIQHASIEVKRANKKNYQPLVEKLENSNAHHHPLKKY